MTIKNRADTGAPVRNSQQCWLIAGCYAGCSWLLFDNSQLCRIHLKTGRKYMSSRMHNSQRKIMSRNSQ